MPLCVRFEEAKKQYSQGLTALETAASQVHNAKETLSDEARAMGGALMSVRRSPAAGSTFRGCLARRGYPAEVSAMCSRSAWRMSVFLHKMCMDAKGSPRVPRQVLFSNRSHVKLMLRDFPGSVDDARRAFGLDPMNVKAPARDRENGLRFSS